MSITRVKNEGDIIEAFVRHTLRAVSKMFISDNGSTDDTLSILYRLKQEGCSIEVEQDPSVGYRQAMRTTDVAQLACAKKDVDWILPLDTDEFVTSSKLHEALPRFADTPVSLCVVSYVPTADDDPREALVLRRIRHRLSREPRPIRKVAVPAALMASEDAYFTTGNHAFVHRGKVIKPRDCETVKLAHFPIRSVEQAMAKVAVGALQFLATPELCTARHHHLFSAYELLKRSPESFGASLPELAVAYQRRPGDLVPLELILDPAPYFGTALIMTPSRPGCSYPIAQVLAQAEDMAVRQAVLLSQFPAGKTEQANNAANVAVSLSRALDERQAIIRELRRQLAEALK